MTLKLDGRQKCSSALLGSLAGPEHKTALRQINRGKVSTVHIRGNAQKKMKIQRNVKPKCVYTRLNEEKRWWKNN